MVNVSHIARPRRKVDIGKMDKRIILQTRNLQPVQPGQTDFTLKFEAANEVWASVKTARGGKFFDGVNLEVSFTHVMFIRFRQGVTPELALFFEDEVYEITDVEDLEQRHEFLKLSCKVNGNKAIKVNLV